MSLRISTTLLHARSFCTVNDDLPQAHVGLVLRRPEGLLRLAEGIGGPDEVLHGGPARSHELQGSGIPKG